MAKGGEGKKTSRSGREEARTDVRLPSPSASYRRRAWIEFQRALDPLAPIKPLPPPRA